jgi:hypothetical protein
VLRDDIPPGANTLSGLYVLGIKDGGTRKERYKARFVVKGQKDLEKRPLFTMSQLSHKEASGLYLPWARFLAEKYGQKMSAKLSFRLLVHYSETSIDKPPWCRGITTSETRPSLALAEIVV